MIFKGEFGTQKMSYTWCPHSVHPLYSTYCLYICAVHTTEYYIFFNTLVCIVNSEHLLRFLDMYLWSQVCNVSFLITPLSLPFRGNESQ